MELSGQILDMDTKTPIPGASITIFRPDGSYTGTGVAANSKGVYYLNSPIAEFPNYIHVSAVGYDIASEQLYPDFYIDFGNTVLLKKKVKELPPVVVTSNNKTGLALLAIPALLLLAGRRDDKKKVSGIPFNTGTVIAVGVGIAFLKGFNIIDSILSALGLKKDKDDTDVANASQDPASPFNITYYQKLPATLQAAAYSAVKPNYVKYVDELLSAFGMFDDDESIAIGVFHHFNTRAQVAAFCYIWQQEYDNPAMLEWLKGGGWPNDRLDTGEINEIIKWVGNLPAN